MTGGTIQAAFADRLARLSGDDFQEAVCGVLARNFHSFQGVVAKPQGDGGIDGISHDFDVIYCCYGLELTALKQLKSVDIKDQVAEKFRSDLRRILELDFAKTQAKKLVKAPNATLAGLWPAGRQAKSIKCICNWYDHSGVIKAINDHFQKYIKASALTFIDPSCTVVFQGPTEFAASVIVDEASLLRLENAGLLKILTGSGTAPPNPVTTNKLNEKFSLLVQAHPSQKDVLEQLRDEIAQEWTQFLSRLNQLENENPQVYERITACVVSLARDAKLQSITLGSAEATTFISAFKGSVAERLKTDLGDLLPADELHPFADHVVAKLIAECPITWSSNAKPNKPN